MLVNLPGSCSTGQVRSQYSLLPVDSPKTNGGTCLESTVVRGTRKPSKGSHQKTERLVAQESTESIWPLKAAEGNTELLWTYLPDYRMLVLNTLLRWVNTELDSLAATNLDCGLDSVNDFKKLNGKSGR